MNDVIHFAHGNGFPSPCYKQLLQGLESRYRCCYIDRIGHSKTFPVTENWTFLIDEIIASVRKHNTKPVIGIGHSLGGALTFIAAIKEPSLFKTVIMLDSPLLNQFKSKVVKVAKALGMIDRITPALRTLGRKQDWENKEQLYTYLKSKPLFETFTEACLQDYIAHGFIETEAGVSLRFDKQVEYAIFRTVPHEWFSYEGKDTVPSLLIYGENSTVVDRFDIRYMKKYYNIQEYKMKGTHMLPMEYPEALAEKIFEILDRVC